MKRGAVCLLVMLWMASFLAGCWNRREIDTLGFVAAFGVDQREDGQVEVTVQVAKPKVTAGEGGAGKEKPYETYSASGKTLFDAIRNLTKKSPRKMWFGHAQMVVIGEEMARRGVLPVMDFVARDHELRRTMWVLVARGTAKDILEADVDMETIPAKSIMRMITIRGATSMAQAARVNEFLKVLSSKHTSATVSVITVSRTEPKEGDKPTLEFHLEGSAVFKEGRLIGFLDATETRGMLWVTGKVRSGIITVPCPDDENERVALEIIRARGEIEPRVDNGKVSFIIKIKEEGNLGEQTSPVDVTIPAHMKELERRKVAVIEAEIGAALRKAQELKADIFEFGEALHRRYPAVWRGLKEKWEGEGFPGISVALNIKAKLRKTGTIGPPIQPWGEGDG